MTEKKTETKDEIIKNLEQQLASIENAMTITMGEIQQRQMKENTLRDRLFRWLPISRKRMQSLEADVLQLSYGMLQIQKQVFHIVKTVHLQQETIAMQMNCECNQKKGDVMYG